MSNAVNDEREHAQDMGRVTVTGRVTNVVDSALAGRGDLAPEDVRSVEVDFLVDTGTTFVCLNRSTIDELGLAQVSEKQVTTSNGNVMRKTYGPVRVEVMDREAATDVMEIPDDVPPLLGYIPLEIMDLVVNPKQQRLEGNPAHGGEYIIDQL